MAYWNESELYDPNTRHIEQDELHDTNTRHPKKVQEDYRIGRRDHFDELPDDGYPEDDGR